MTKESRENERMKIRQEHITKALSHIEHYLTGLLQELKQLIDVYKQKDWKPNPNYIKWKDEIELELATIKRQKILYREKIQETVNSFIPLDEFK